MTDNGRGIDSRDVALAFERHATSKIHKLEDMYCVRSFGFRGEALPSIAAVSSMEVRTRQRDALSGMKILLENGLILASTETGCPQGTSILVKDIFGSIPVRRKFLKKDGLEQSYCLEMITRLALAHPEIKIKVLSGGKGLLNIPKTGELFDRISLILGADSNKKMLAVCRKIEGISVTGFISKPEFTRSNAKSINFYVNKRYVRDHLISHATMNAYRGKIEARKYPLVVLFLELAAGEVDVNVHPSKTEVRFRDSKSVYELVLQAVASALSGNSLTGTATGFAMANADRQFGAGDIQRAKEGSHRYVVSAGIAKPFYQRSSEPLLSLTSSSDAMEPAKTPAENGFFSTLNYLGHIAGVYLVFSSPGRMIMIDQHAAHERILFEKMKENARDHKVSGQPLLIPEVIELSPSDLALLEEFREVFQETGMEFSVLGNNTVVFKSVPYFLMDQETGGIVSDILADVAEIGKSHSLEEVSNKIFASLACKAAIKAHDMPTDEEIKALCRDLDRVPNAASCPHGRPVYVEFTAGDLERMFKRR